VNGLEAVADAIQQFEGWKPGTRSYKNRNPGNLRLSDKPKDDKGYTIEPDFITGYADLLADLKAKFSGHNDHGLTQQSTLLALMNVYAPASDSNAPDTYADFVASWVAHALGKPITAESELAEIWQPVTAS
jgi:hypothetical protein